MAAPTVTSLTPSTGTTYGGTAVVILGTGFTAATAVTFGGVNATTYTVYSSTIIAAESPAHSAGAVTVCVTTADGTSADVVQFTYSSGTGLFSVAEARAFQGGKLQNTASFPDADITAAETRIRTAFTDICGVYFISTSTAEYVDGGGTSEILVSETKVSAVTSCVIYSADGTVNETFDSDDLSDLAIYPGGFIVRKSRGTFLAGRRNILITYTHGFDAVPSDIKQAALILLLNELTLTNLSERATGYNDGNMTIQLATAGMRGAWFGLPLVDSVLARYKRNIPALA